MQSEYREVAVKAVKEAEKVILNHYEKGVKVETKPDKTPVTVADKEAEAVIIETIKERYPDHGFIGEETGESPGNSEFTWIIDPIDGTKNYIRKIPFFGTLLGLMKGNEIILGISNVPLLNEFLVAERGRGACCNGKQIKVSDVDSLKDSLTIYGSLKKFARDDSINLFQKLVHNSGYNKGYGGIFSYHFVAKGSAEAMVELDVRIWDIAPFVPIMEEAGGNITDIQGKPVTRDIRTCLATNGKVHDAMLDILKNFS